MRLAGFAHRTLAERAFLADPPNKGRSCDGLGVVGKFAVAQKRLRAGGSGEISDLVRHQSKIGRDPDRAEAKGREHREEHLLAVLRMRQDTVAPADAARAERRGERRGRGIDFAPGPGSLAPDKACAVTMPARILRRQITEIHHAARHPRQSAARRSAIDGGIRAHLRPSQTPAASSTMPASPDAIACFICTRVTSSSCPGKKPGNWSAGIRAYMAATTSRMTPSTVSTSFMGFPHTGTREHARPGGELCCSVYRHPGTDRKGRQSPVAHRSEPSRASPRT